MSSVVAVVAVVVVVAVAAAAAFRDLKSASQWISCSFSL